MFPIQKREIIRGFRAHIDAGLGGAADYSAFYVPYYAPKDGSAYEPYAWTFRRGTGGWWCGIQLFNGDKIEAAHMSRVFIRSGFVKEGTLLGITGNTGSKTSGPHLHEQIINKVGARIDPEKYPWGREKPLIERVNEALRSAGSIVDIPRSMYWQERVKNGDKTTFEDLVNGIKFRMVNRLTPHENGR